MSAYISAQLREQVITNAGGRCAYCQSREDLTGVTFEADHIVPESAGGPTSLENLCLSCPTCNRHKARRLIAQDPVSGDSVPLFHPLQQPWTEHFTWSSDGTEVIGLTSVGRATIEALHMNRTVIVQLRAYWVALDLHPPG
jgi:hypothetical protein